MGVFFAVAFGAVGLRSGGAGRHGSRAVTAVVGLLGFIAAFGVPFFVYPANPPAVGNDDTIGERSGAFLTITLVSVIAMVIAVVVALQLRDRLGGLASTTVAGIGYLVVIAIAKALLPGVPRGPRAAEERPGRDRVPRIPRWVIGDFRVYAITNQVVLWTVLTLVFAAAISAIGRRTTDAAGELVASAR